MARVYSDRFEVRDTIANGAFGVVYEAYDRERQELVALKSVRYDQPEDARLLKREFRVLRDVNHDNLLPLHHLACDEGEWFFTMALIRGDPMSEICTKLASTGDYRSLADLFRGVCEGLAHLHSNGILHRDLKPQNVVVADGNRAVLLDFGLSTRITLEASRRSRQGTFSGSAAYAAPEQLFGENLSPAADWFAMGMMLYEAVSGSRPDREELNFDIDPKRALGEGVPEALSQLTWQLLRPDAERRPKYAAIRRMLEEVTHTAPAGGLVTADPIRVVGREQELELLNHWRREVLGNTVTVALQGPPGFGKTHLAEAFFQERERRGDLVLRAMCHPDERVPYNAIDGLMDDAVRFLRSQPLGFVRASIPDAMAPLAAMFPSLGELAPALTASDSVFLDTDRLHRATEQLIDFLAMLGQRRPLSLFIDDIQWADRDSRRLLDRIQHQRLAGIFIVATSESAPSEPGAGLEPRYTLTLGPLVGQGADEFGAELQRRFGLPPQVAAAAIKSAEGHPYLAELVGRHMSGSADPTNLPTDLGQVLDYELESLEPDELELVELLAVAAGPLPRDALANELSESTPLEALRDWLERRQLVALLRRGTTVALIIPHAALKRRARERLEQAGPEVTRQLHARITNILLRNEEADPFALIYHFRGAGRPQEALRHAEEAIVIAERSLAFDTAVQLHHMAMELMEPADIDSAVALRLAQLNENAGRAVDSGKAFIDAAARLETEGAGDDVVLTTLARGASQLLRGGAREEGMTWVRTVIERVGLPWRKSFATTLASIVWQRAALRLGRRGEPSEPDEANRRRLDMLWDLSSGLSFYDSPRAFELQARHARLAHRVGDPRHRALALATDAMVRSLEQGSQVEPMAIRLLSEARALAANVDDPQVEAHFRLMRALVTYTGWRFESLVREARSGLAFCRTYCRGSSWERAGLIWIEACGLGKLSRFDELRTCVGAALREADRLGDAYLATMVRMGPSILGTLALDAPSEVLAESAAARATGGRSGFLDYLYTFAVGRAHLYRADIVAAAGSIGDGLASVGRAGMLRFPLVRLEMLDLQGRVGLAAIAIGESGVGAEAMLRRAVKGLKKLKHPAAPATIAMLEAQKALLDGDRRTAGLMFGLAAGGFESVSLPVDAQVASALATWSHRPNTEPDELFAMLLETGVVRPELFLRTLVPAVGFGE